VDLGTLLEGEEAEWLSTVAGSREQSGGVATALWAPPAPTFLVPTEAPDQDQHEVRNYDARQASQLVAAVEIVSPGNKDRRENRRSFVAKCAGLLQARVCVTIVDLATLRELNLYADLLDLIGETDPSPAAGPSCIYAVSLRWTRKDRTGTLETWTQALEMGRHLPTLPLWLNSDLAVPLDLEASYHQTRLLLRIP
jgi:hypothetical protein